MLEINKIYQGDCLEVLKTLPDESINCCVTSPPYWALRDYGVEGQVGLEPTFQEYIEKLCLIFDEVKRVLKKDGSCWVNMGDTYISKGESRHNGYSDPKYKNGRVGRLSEPNAMPQSLCEKNLAQIPSRFAIAMTDRGWILRNEIIWFKPNCMPSSAKDRFTVDFEKVFFFVKNKKYYFEQILEPVKESSLVRAKKRLKTNRPSAGKNGIDVSEMGSRFVNPLGRNMRTVWKINTKGTKEAHFATYPEDLIEPMILAGCPEFICNKCGKSKEKIIEYKKGDWIPTLGTSPDAKKGGNRTRLIIDAKVLGYSDCGCNAEFSSGIVLDPFFGAGTTGLVAKKFNRNFIGIELNPEYIKIAEARLTKPPKVKIDKPPKPAKPQQIKTYTQELLF